MSGGFNNPIIGGGGSLVYPSIHSPNFLTGVSGWSINKNGTAEFNNIIIRNGQVISGVFLLYTSAIPAKGNLAAAFAPLSGGTDSVGNVYPQGFNFGIWSASTGALLQHFGMDINGNTYLANSSGKTVAFGQASDGSQSYYNSSGLGTGNLVASVAPAAGTDPVGNTYMPGITSYDPTGVVQVFAGGINLWPSTPFNAGNIFTNDLGMLAFTSPTQSAPDITALFRLRSSLESLSGQPEAEFQTVIRLIEASSVPPATFDYVTLFTDLLCNLEFVSGIDTNAYDTGRNTQLTPNPSGAGQIINNTLTTILSKHVAGATYHLHAKVVYLGNQSGGVPTISMAGPSPLGGTNDMAIIKFTVLNNGATQPIADFGRGGYPSNAGPTLVLNQFVEWELDMVATFNVAGTVLIQGISSIGGDTFTIQALSYLDVMPRVAV